MLGAIKRPASHLPVLIRTLPGGPHEENGLNQGNGYTAKSLSPKGLKTKATPLTKGKLIHRHKGARKIYAPLNQNPLNEDEGENGAGQKDSPFHFRCLKSFRKEEADMEEQIKEGKLLATREKDVEFILRSPNAMKVYLAGEFNYWEAESLPMEKNRKEFGRLRLNYPRP